MLKRNVFSSESDQSMFDRIQQQNSEDLASLEEVARGCHTLAVGCNGDTNKGQTGNQFVNCRHCKVRWKRAWKPSSAKSNHAFDEDMHRYCFYFRTMMIIVIIMFRINFVCSCIYLIIPLTLENC